MATDSTAPAPAPAPKQKRRPRMVIKPTDSPEVVAEKLAIRKAYKADKNRKYAEKHAAKLAERVRKTTAVDTARRYVQDHASGVTTRYHADVANKNKGILEKAGEVGDNLPALHLEARDAIEVPRLIVDQPRAPSPDEANPTSFLSMEHWMLTVDKNGKESTRKAHVERVRRFLKASGIAEPNEVKDLVPIFRDVDKNLRFIESPDFKQANGKPLKESSKTKTIISLSTVAGRFTPLSSNLTQAIKDRYQILGKAREGADKTVSEERAKTLKVIPFNEIMQRAASEFGKDSTEFVFLNVFKDAPARDDLGGMQIFEGIPPHGVMNSLVLKNPTEGDEMGLLFRKHKTDSRGQRWKSFSDRTAELVRKYLREHAQNKYLFSKESVPSKAYGSMSAFVSRMLARMQVTSDIEGLPIENGVAGAINYLRHSWATTYTGELGEGPAANLMDHSIGVHNNIYMNNRQTVLDVAGDTDQPRPRKTGPARLDEGDEAERAGPSTAKPAKPAKASKAKEFVPQASHDVSGYGAVAGDSDSDEEVDNIRKTITKAAKTSSLPPSVVKAAVTAALKALDEKDRLKRDAGRVKKSLDAVRASKSVKVAGLRTKAGRITKTPARFSK